ncbi:tRNA-dihydrouridine(47) synthase [NAD(P)(+)]-like [Protobothrops mucrosquamatus]|uniref:tRNA-dihydrouridine(47) synthase [NAD(P)(+)]-like n=2 Tax=Protobothrops mucrosquamatus TaxID=103944 RepID=UPI000775D57F|nr:tRNA-dihydrouridine(47) synthase [NAD(P)(+)]-like [Protobothrops mucrosquamatus]
MEAAGVAPIRAQYRCTKEDFHAYLEKEEKPRKDPDGAKNNLEAEPGLPPAKLQKLELDGAEEERPAEVAVAAESAQGPPGRKRLRGQNKNRPCMKPAHYEKQRLCPSVVHERVEKCFYGAKCRFLHDLKEYMAAKPPDLGGRCLLFETFGRCTYGATCRFAGAHLGEDYKNRVNAELLKQWEGRLAVRNSLSKDVQQQLRKKKMPFARSSEYLRSLGKSHPARRPGTWDASPVAAKTGVSDCSEGPKEPGMARLEAPDNPNPSEEEGLGSAPKGSSPSAEPALKRLGAVTDEDTVKLRPSEKAQLDLRGKLYLAPLTTCGNLPFRRVCKGYGADVTCGEMAVCTNLLQGQSSEWALLKRHETEDLFGVQLEGAFPDTMTKCAELLNQTIEVDFVDINVGCPIDLVYNKGGGCALMTRNNKFEQIVRGMNSVLDVPLTVKIRTGVQEKTNLAHKVIPNLREWGASLVTLHGRSREQRYTKMADWEYIAECVKVASPMPLFGNGDIFSFEDANRAMTSGVSGIMIARGALIKPWIFTEIKEQRHWDISSRERLEILQDYTNYGLEHWGSDTQGVEKTRKFLLEWLSFLCRYIPVGLLERLPQRINERPPYYLGRDPLETLMASQNVDDWVKISEMLLGRVPADFSFLPKHKANSYK